ncbi:condensation domain-containing protein, partial [Rhodococcus koreensis]|uniref:condensation domain-containing protein n=1 Tax=Rhodococcus koreensis TaxID=99653 RepID=UPI00366BBC14
TPTTTEPLDTTTITAHAARHLPNYMVPTTITVLDELPLTPNGKIDRHALPTPTLPTTEYHPPTTPTEHTITEIFTHTLGINHISTTDNFFDLGGNSLTATQVVARINEVSTVAVDVGDFFTGPTVAELAVVVDAAHDLPGHLPLVPGNREGPLPLSLAQQRMWFINQYDTTSPAYNIPLAVRLRGPLDTTALTHALTDVVTRHETLRTHYPDSDDGPHQVVHEPSPLELPATVVDENELDEQLARFAAAGFDVATEIPLRVALFEIGPADHVLALVVHHICADGASMQPLARDLVVAYSARQQHREPTWAPLPVQYGDYTLWQRHTLGTEDDPDSTLS